MISRITQYAVRFLNIKTILIAFLVLGVIYSVVTPAFEAPDEMAHFAYVKSLVDGHGLPQSPIRADDDAPAQESSQLPLYYLTSALAVRLLAPDTSDFSTLLMRNRFFPYIRFETINDNRNMFVPIASQPFPYQGAMRALHLARFVSLLFGALAVAATYALGKEPVPGRPGVALIAAASVAFIPQFIFISGAVSNDSTTAATCALSLWLTVRILRRGLNWRRAAALGCVLGLGALSKASAIALLPTAFLAILAEAWLIRPRGPHAGRVIGFLALSGLIAVVIAGPWYWRLHVVFGDFAGVTPHLSMPWARPAPLSFLASLADWQAVVNSFWLALGWGTVTLPGWVYGFLALLALLGGLGAIAAWRQSQDRIGQFIILFLSAWVIIVCLALFRWNQTFNAALGRLAFPAISAVGVLLAIGWNEIGSWPRLGQARFLKAVMPASLLALSILVIPFLLVPAFAGPQLLTEEQLAQQPGRPVDIQYGDVARLRRAFLLQDTWPHPAERATVRLCWEVLRQDARELLEIVQFVGTGDRVVAVRRTHPGLGNYPTRIWQPGARFCDDIDLPVEADAPTPAIYALDVALFDHKRYERLPAYAPDGTLLSTNFVDQIKLAPPQYDLPAIEHATEFQLGDSIELVGHALEPVVVKPGESLPVRLYWRALRPPGADYTVFLHLRNDAEKTIAQADGAPQSGAYPTSFWDPGEVVSDEHIITIPSDAAAGRYHVVLGLYQLESGERLPVLNQPESEITLPVTVEVR